MSDIVMPSIMPIVSGLQLRAARALAALSRADLAERTGLCIGTVARLERERGAPSIETLQRVIGTLEASGIRFLRDGVLLQKERGT
jgi:transcriptional regulator with XRE-family HTH domain